MPNYELDNIYMNIVRDIIDNDEFAQLTKLKHHSGTRFEHSIKVSYYSYVLARKLRLNYVEVARAGLLHDFYLEQVNDQKKVKDKLLLFTTQHPERAVQNAEKFFKLSDREKDIIRTHMFPIDIKIPKYSESWIVSLVDKYVSAKEFGTKFSTKIAWASNVSLLILLRFMK